MWHLHCLALTLQQLTRLDLFVPLRGHHAVIDGSVICFGLPTCFRSPHGHHLVTRFLTRYRQTIDGLRQHRCQPLVGPARLNLLTIALVDAPRATFIKHPVVFIHPSGRAG